MDKIGTRRERFYLLSIIVFQDDVSKTSKCINSLPKNKDVEVILIESDISDEKDAYKKGFDLANGEYVLFVKSSSFFLQFSSAIINEVKKMNFPIYVTNCNYITPKKNVKRYFNYDKYNQISAMQNKKQFEICNYVLGCYIVKKDVISDAFWKYNLTAESIILGLIIIVAKLHNICHLAKVILTISHAPETDFYNYEAQFSKNWYIETIEKEWIPLLRLYSDNEMLQNAIFYLLKIRFACNRNDRNKNILSPIEVESFLVATKNVLKLIPDNIILNYSVYRKILPRYMNFYLLKLKYDGYAKLEYKFFETEGGSREGAFFNDNLVHFSDSQVLHIKVLNVCNDKLQIDGLIDNTYILNENDFCVFAQVDDTRIKLENNSVYSLDKYFNISWNKQFTFFTMIPISEKVKTIAFVLKSSRQEIWLPIVFNGVYSKLKNDSKYNYCKIAGFSFKYDGNTKKIKIYKHKIFKSFFQEILLLLSYLKHAVHDFKLDFIKRVVFRTIYWISKPFFLKKNIWITYDQLFKGGDNGEYFFKYVAGLKHRNCDIYYIINSTAKEYPALKRQYGKKILEFKSIRCRLTSLNAKYIFATRVAVNLFLGIPDYLAGLFNAKIFCLQHGLTVQRIAQYQNRIFDNTQLYFCVSPYEIKNLSHPVYGYFRENLLLTGAPRYDGLVPVETKQILIAPSWRRNVTAGTNTKGKENEYSVNFKNTNYYRIYNSLINDERLISCAKELGYKLLYLIHPILSPQIDDFVVNDYVEIVRGSDVDYNEVMSHSCLMLTDYSGVQFDFAYMRKPLIYYHPDELPPQYEPGGLVYDTMGFGPVCKNQEDIVTQLIKYMENNCQLEDIYKKRIDNFFVFNDRNNSKRIYDTVLKYELSSNKNDLLNNCLSDTSEPDLLAKQLATYTENMPQYSDYDNNLQG